MSIREKVKDEIYMKELILVCNWWCI